MMRATKSKAELRSAETNRHDKVFWQELLKEREERASKTARLRALRLAKEASEREAEERLTVEQAAAKTTSFARKARLIKRDPTTLGNVA